MLKKVKLVVCVCEKRRSGCFCLVRLPFAAATSMTAATPPTHPLQIRPVRVLDALLEQLIRQQNGYLGRGGPLLHIKYDDNVT